MAPVFPNAPASQFVEGLQIPAMFPTEAVLSAIKYQPRDDDIFIVTYPKCGTTWTQHIVALIFSQGEPISPTKFFSIAPFMEITGAKVAEDMPRPGAIKVHLPFHLTPRSEKAKYIYITRNPKDCCVSYFHHMKNIPGHGFNGDFNEFFEMFLSGEIDYGDYFDHLMVWYEHRNDPNVLFMTYEDMKEDPKASILKIATFIDEKLYAEPLRNDPEKLHNVLKYSSFDYMKQTVNKSFSDMVSMTKEEILNSELPDTMKKLFTETMSLKQMEGQEMPNAVTFVRKGIIGDWRNYFSDDQSKRMDKRFAERTKGTDISNFWKDYL